MSILHKPRVTAGQVALYHVPRQSIYRLVRLKGPTGGSAGGFSYYITEPTIEPRGVWGFYLTPIEGLDFREQFGAFLAELSCDEEFVNEAGRLLGNQKLRLLGLGANVGEVHPPHGSKIWTATIDGKVIAEVEADWHVTAIERLSFSVLDCGVDV